MFDVFQCFIGCLSNFFKKLSRLEIHEICPIASVVNYRLISTLKSCVSVRKQKLSTCDCPCVGAGFNTAPISPDDKLVTAVLPGIQTEDKPCVYIFILLKLHLLFSISRHFLAATHIMLQINFQSKYSLGTGNLYLLHYIRHLIHVHYYYFHKYRRTEFYFALHKDLLNSQFIQNVRYSAFKPYTLYQKKIILIYFN